MFFIDLNGSRVEVKGSSYLQKSILIQDSNNKYLYFYCQKNTTYKNSRPTTTVSKYEISESVFNSLKTEAKLEIIEN